MAFDSAKLAKVQAVVAFQLAGRTAANLKIKANESQQDIGKCDTRTKKVDLALPPKPPTDSDAAVGPCIEKSANCSFPIPALVDTRFNINAKHGGGTALLFAVRVSQGKDVDSTELFLVRCGFDGNHFSSASLAQGGEHSIWKNWNELMTDCDGYLLAKLQYGQSTATLISNIAAYGDGGCGIVFEGPDATSSESKVKIRLPSSIRRTVDQDRLHDDCESDVPSSDEDDVPSTDEDDLPSIDEDELANTYEDDSASDDEHGLRSGTWDKFCCWGRCNRNHRKTKAATQVNAHYPRLPKSCFRCDGEESLPSSDYIYTRCQGLPKKRETTCALVICSVNPSPSGEAPSQTYFLHFDEQGEVKKVPLHPLHNDEWTFDLDDEVLEINGPTGSHYAMFHSKSSEFGEKHLDRPRGKVLHLQAVKGSDTTTLLPDVSGCVGRSMLLLCSHSFNNEDSTVSALYQVTTEDCNVQATYLHGLASFGKSADIWKISLINDKTLVITGPGGPCRYAILTNINEDISDTSMRLPTPASLATATPTVAQGGLMMDDDRMTVWVDNSVKVLVTLNGRKVQEVEGGNWLEQPDGRLAFQREFTYEENSPGLKIFRAFAIVKSISGEDVSIELEGSPKRVIRQPPGVAFALNCGGPAYQALNNAVFNDFQTVFVKDDMKGVQCNRKFSHYMSSDHADHNFHGVIDNTYDTFLFSSNFQTHQTYADEFKLDLNIPSGDYTMRLYSIGNDMVKGRVTDDNESFTREQVNEQLIVIPESVEGLTAKTCEVPLKVVKDGTSLTFESGNGDAIIAGVLVYDKDFKEPKTTPEEELQELKVKQELADKLQPLNRAFKMKEMKIAGWSANLLENASGEAGDMSYWNYGGDFKIENGGDETEKRFVTSYMNCTKEQDIDLINHLFSEQFLDTAPDIQASESFHAGSHEGGYYTFTVTLTDAEGNVIANQTTGRKGNITETGWIRESFTFKDYGPGVRNITFKSSGRDNVGWRGHFGTYISAGMLRVKSEVTAASDDTYADVTTVTVEERKHEVGALLRELTAKFRSDEDDLEVEDSTEADDNSSDEFPKPNGQERRKSFHFAPGHMKPRKTKREVRIFVSSTFRDFSEEREMIIKKVFRELNRLCLDRGVFFTYVDLRWGITEKQTKSGKTIDICLREVDKCRPYFICMMGDRYGWSQTEKKKDKLLNESFTYASNSQEGFQWVDQFRFDTSVTKLEVLHAAIRPNQNINKQRIFFYLRTPRISRDQLPPPVESTDPKDKPKGETQWHFDQQQKLRQSILESGFTHRTFEGATDGSNMIRDDLMKCIDEDFPPGTNLSHLQMEQEAHIAFAEARRRVYIGRQEYFDDIDSYFEGSTQKPLTIIGESGSGKSALFANWCGRYEEKNPQMFLFMHFIGSSAESASYLNMLRRLYDEMKQFFELDMEVPSSDRNLVIELPSWLKIAGKRSKVMIVLDALNQLDSGVGGSDLTWLPSDLPDNVHMLLSTLPGQSHDAVVEFGWPMYKVEPLHENEKQNIISGYMGLYGKTLNQEQTDLIINAKQSSNPLYLRALLDEVRVYGIFEQLTTAIKSYLTADNPGALFGKILERLEADFENGEVSRPGLVRDTTVAIWCSRRGMSENELLTLLKVPSLVWSPFYLSLEENLINKNGIVNFFHDHLRQAVEARYLPTDEDKRQGYLKLANFFNAQDIDDRYADEMPYLLARANELTRLRATILNILVFKTLMKTEDGRFQLIKAWRILGGFGNVEQAYLDVLSRAEVWGKSGDQVELIKCIAIFFTQLGLLGGARILNERLLKDMERMYISKHSTIVQHHLNQSYKHRCNHPKVIDTLIELGDVCVKQEELIAAEFHLEDALTRLTKPNTPEKKLQLVKALIGLGTVHRLRGDLDFAKKFMRRALEVSKDVVGPDHHYAAALIGQLGELCYDQSRLGDAMILHEWDFTQTQKDVGLDHPHIAAILNNIGLVQDDMQDKSAEKTFKLALGILLEAYGKDHVNVATVRYNLGARFFGNNMYERARYQFEEAYRVFNLFLEDHPSTRTAQKAVQMVKEI